jgi:hypothetical protein
MKTILKFSNAYAENNLIIRKVLLNIKVLAKIIRNSKICKNSKNVNLNVFLMDYLNAKI